MVGRAEGLWTRTQSAIVLVLWSCLLFSGFSSAQDASTDATADCSVSDNHVVLEDWTVAERAHFAACQTLTAGPFAIGPNADVHFSAGQRITLKRGFRARRNATFTARVASLQGGFPSPYQFLAVNKTGTGSGVVTSPDGIDCGETCSGGQIYNLPITLTATADPGSTFVGWSDHCTGSSNTCTVTMSQPRWTTAHFASNLPDLLVTEVLSPASGEAGELIEIMIDIANQGAADVGTFFAGIYLSTDSTITPSDINTNSWCQINALAAGASALCGGPIQVPASVPDGDYYLGAYADPANAIAESNETNNGRAAANRIRIGDGAGQYSLTVTKTGTGSGRVTTEDGGIDCGATCTANFAAGATVDLTAAATAGSTFTGWSGDCSGAATICPVSMTSARSVVAHFATSVPGGPNQVLGPLSGATIEAYRLEDLDFPVEGSFTAHQSVNDIGLAGTFELPLTGLANDAWVLVGASGGLDLDANADGALDVTPTVNQGTLHAIAPAADWRSGSRINPLTDIAARYAWAWIDNASREALAERLDRIAAVIFASDLNGDGRINRRDLLDFQPGNATHRSKLDFDYTLLLHEGGFMEGIHTDLPETELQTRLAAIFGADLAFARPDFIGNEVAVRLSTFGRGRVVGDRGGLFLDVEDQTAEQTPIAFFARGDGEVTFTATPTAETRILFWDGCDWIADDLSQCRIDLLSERQVSVGFGYRVTEIVPAFIDLTRATVVRSGDRLEVRIDPLDDAFLAEMAAVDEGTYVAGLADAGPFLLRVESVSALGPNRWELMTREATLEEVVLQGTGTLRRALTHADLDQSALAAGMRLQSASADMPAVEIVPADPSETVFRLRLVGKAEDAGVAPQSFEGNATWKEKWTRGGVDMEIEGAVDVEIDIDIGASFSWTGLQSLRFIPSVELRPSLSATVSGALETPKDDDGKDLWRTKLTTIPFSPIAFAIGPVPVWVQPHVDIYVGVNGELKAKLETAAVMSASAWAGLSYERGRSLDSKESWPFGFDRSWTPEPPTLEGEARLSAYVSAKPSLMIYSATGPGFDLEAALDAKATINLTSECPQAIDYGLSAVLRVFFEWKTQGSDTKFGRLIGADMFRAKSLIFRLDHAILNGTLFGCDPDSTPNLAVSGQDLNTSLVQGTSLHETIEYGVANLGDNALEWAISTTDPLDLIASTQPDSGRLGPGQTQVVTITVAETAGLPVKDHRATIDFKTSTDDPEPIRRSLRLSVKAGDLARPVITQAAFVGSESVSIAWDYPESAVNQVGNFRIWSAYDPSFADLAPSFHYLQPDVRNTTFGGLRSNRVFVAVEAASSDGERTGFSDIIEVWGPPAPVKATPLNDTGIVRCADASRNDLPCPVSGYPGQDAQYGRDVTHNDDSDGHAGFSFTKLDAAGNALSAGASQWSCVRDNVTGLVWEVKTDDGGLRDKDWTYSWYNPNSDTNGGSAGYADYGNNCYDPARCDTHKYVADVNSQGLCGARDWRLPDRFELESITSDGPYSHPAIDEAFFPNTKRSTFASSSPDANYSDGAWGVSFNYGHVVGFTKFSPFRVRLVRGGQ